MRKYIVLRKVFAIFFAHFQNRWEPSGVLFRAQCDAVRSKRPPYLNRYKTTRESNFLKSCTTNTLLFGASFRPGNKRQTIVNVRNIRTYLKDDWHRLLFCVWRTRATPSCCAVVEFANNLLQHAAGRARDINLWPRALGLSAALQAVLQEFTCAYMMYLRFWDDNNNNNKFKKSTAAR